MRLPQPPLRVGQNPRHDVGPCGAAAHGCFPQASRTCWSHSLPCHATLSGPALRAPDRINASTSALSVLVIYCVLAAHNTRRPRDQPPSRPFCLQSSITARSRMVWNNSSRAKRRNHQWTIRQEGVNRKHPQLTAHVRHLLRDYSETSRLVAGRCHTQLLLRPPIGAVVSHDLLRRASSISREYGGGRGTAIDRYYIGDFLARHADDVRGTAHWRSFSAMGMRTTSMLLPQSQKSESRRPRRLVDETARLFPSLENENGICK
jgi:hypothetical protein